MLFSKEMLGTYFSKSDNHSEVENESTEKIEKVKAEVETIEVGAHVEDSPYTDEAIWERYNYYLSKGFSSENGYKVLYCIRKPDVEDSPFECIGVMITLGRYSKKASTHWSYNDGNDGFYFKRAYYYNTSEETLDNEWSRGDNEICIDLEKYFDFVTKEAFDSFISSERKKYQNAFRDIDIMQYWFRIGVIKEISEAMGVYIIKIDGKFIDEKGKCWVAYSVSDMIRTPNDWKPMNYMEWEEFQRMYSTEEPTYLEINYKDIKK